MPGKVALEPNAPLLDERQQRQVQDAAVRRVMLQSDARKVEPEVVTALTMLGRVAKPRGIAEALRMILRERDVLVPAIDRCLACMGRN